jgi:hypothetical protein
LFQQGRSGAGVHSSGHSDVNYHSVWTSRAVPLSSFEGLWSMYSGLEDTDPTEFWEIGAACACLTKGLAVKFRLRTVNVRAGNSFRIKGG